MVRLETVAGRNRMRATARHHRMTPDEIEAQRRSWVIGELMLDDPDLTREAAEALYDQASREGA